MKNVSFLSAFVWCGCGFKKSFTFTTYRTLNILNYPVLKRFKRFDHDFAPKRLSRKCCLKRSKRLVAVTLHVLTLTHTCS